MLVGKEDYCDFHTVQAAVDALERQSGEEMATLYILSGVYEETVRIYRSNLNIIGLGEVVITNGRYARELDENGVELGTFGTPTLFLGGRRLTLENLAIVNNAGQGEHIGQALAVYANCDETVFRSCTFKGHQDTLFTGPLPPWNKQGGGFGGIPLKEHHESYRQLYIRCCIEGTVDFIFGGATAYFDHCEIRSLRNDKGSRSYITAASTPEGQNYGYIFNECYLTAEDGVTGVYLGRPWRGYARTELVNCKLGRHIEPQGWDNWGNPANEETVTYAEYGIPGGDELRKLRVSWAVLPEEGTEAPAKEQVFAGTDFWK
ncbi:pectin methylesterase [Paenibacillus sp. PK3_47]|uniref:pectinesterase family protein n=1 Tax=Paenibacillus sp. PK3_47 TaxID=2072642 RepID=UPI00201E121D|nr:pectinesterase family protein [Paenibacillus sp. PK3_47]UQZ32623.1 pectin methylesterase [Paenibacillus sp. PK3_47]